MIDVNRSFVNNTDLNEKNSLAHLIEKLDPINEGEVNPIQHSNYYSNEEFMGALRQIDGKLSILNLNCQCINSKFDKIKLFLEGINNNSMPFSVITLQETWADNETDMNFFNLPNYTMVYEDSRLSKHGGLVTYIHNTFSFERLSSNNMYNQNSTVYESIGTKVPLVKLSGTTPNCTHKVNISAIWRITSLSAPCTRCSAVMSSAAGAELRFKL